MGIMEKKMEMGLYRGNIGIMEKKTETTIRFPLGMFTVGALRCHRFVTVAYRVIFSIIPI